MYKNKKIIAIIPARGGSRGVPRKNIIPLNGSPLISYAINAAKKSRYIDRVLVSTDDQEIADIAKKHGAEVPFLRPKKFATNSAPTLLALKHAVKFVESTEKKRFDLVVTIQPTTPLLLADDIDLAIEKLFKTKTNSCVGVCEVSERPEWMRVFSGDKIKPFLTGEFRRRQDWPKIFRVNGAVYVTKRDVLMKKNIILDKNSSAIIMPKRRSLDIDEPIDFKIVEAVLAEND